MAFLQQIPCNNDNIHKLCYEMQPCTSYFSAYLAGLLGDKIWKRVPLHIPEFLGEKGTKKRYGRFLIKKYIGSFLRFKVFKTVIWTVAYHLQLSLSAAYSPW